MMKGWICGLRPSMVRHYLASGAYRSPQGVITDALHALQEMDAMRSRDKQAAEDSREVLPIVRWLQETARPRMGLKKLRRRLAKIPGSMSDDLEKAREDRF